MAALAHGKNSSRHLVIFGCGYIGGAVAEAALAQGLAVTALTRNPATAERLRAKGATVVVADLASDTWHRHVLAAPAWVLDCVSSGGAGTDGYRHSYVDGMTSILRWAENHGRIGTLVYTSSTSVYPQGEGATVDETASTAAAGERPAILIEAERQLARSERACDRWFVLRLAGIYGPGRHHLLDQARAGVMAGRGDHRLNLAHRDDIVAAVFACFQAAPGIRNEVFNVADDGAAAKSELVGWLAGRIGAPAPQFTGEPAAGRRAVTPDRVIANGKAKSLLGWQPRFPTYREGYTEILRGVGS